MLGIFTRMVAKHAKKIWAVMDLDSYFGTDKLGLRTFRRVFAVIDLVIKEPRKFGGRKLQHITWC